MPEELELEVGGIYLSRDGYRWQIHHMSPSMDMTGDDMYFGKPLDLPGDRLYRFWPNGVSVNYPGTIFDLVTVVTEDTGVVIDG